jgi:hypothetical protein
MGNYMPMKDRNKSQKEPKKQQADAAFRSRTKLPGQNPRANDDPSHDQNNDENRQP